MEHLIDVLIKNISNPLSVLLLTLGIYQLMEYVFVKLGRKGWLHPLITSSLLIFLVIKFSPLTLETYQAHSEILKTLLAPFTVALAIPLSSQVKHLRNLAMPLVLSLASGSILAAVIGVGLAWLTGGTPEVLLALSPKAVTTAVAMVMAEQMETIVPLAVSAVVVSGIYGGLVGPVICRKLGIVDPRVVGFTMGINAHAAGTARAFELDITMGVYASLGMCLNAIFTPVILPVAINLLS